MKLRLHHSFKFCYEITNFSDKKKRIWGKIKTKLGYIHYIFI